MQQGMFLKRDSSRSVPQVNNLAEFHVGGVEGALQLHIAHHLETPQCRVLSEISTATNTK